MTVSKYSEKKYSVHSIFLTVQGEGFHAGKVAVFVRFSGCDMWTGIEDDRARDAGLKSACAAVCDTEFRGFDELNGGGKYTAEQLADKIADLYPKSANWEDCFKSGSPAFLVVFTGGEPCLQLDDSLCRAVSMRGGRIHVETNGRHEVSPYVDWVTLSPKPPPSNELGLTWIKAVRYNEIKVLYPLFNPLDYAPLCNGVRGLCDHKWVQPVDPPVRAGCMWDASKWKANVEACFKFVQEHPDWRISVQGHKLLQMA